MNSIAEDNRKAGMSEQNNEQQEGSGHGQPGSSAVDKAVVKEVFAELLSEIPGLKNLVGNFPGTTEAAAQQGGKGKEKQSVSKSKPSCSVEQSCMGTARGQ